MNTYQQGSEAAVEALGFSKVAYNAGLTRRIMAALSKMGLRNGPSFWGQPGALHVPNKPGLLQRLDPSGFAALTMQRTPGELAAELRTVRPLSDMSFAKRTSPSPEAVDRIMLSGAHGSRRGPFKMNGPADLKPHNALEEPGVKLHDRVWKGSPRHAPGYNPGGPAWVSPVPGISSGYTYQPGGWLEAFDASNFSPRPKYTPHIGTDTRGWSFDKVKAARRTGNTTGRSAISSYPYYEGVVTQSQLDAARPTSSYRRGHLGFYHVGGEDVLAGK